MYLTKGRFEILKKVSLARNKEFERKIYLF